MPSPSPNQADKRGQIVEAAREVLVREGLAGCTARALADQGPLTKSAIHYYFGSMEEIVDLAMAAHIDAIVARLRAVDPEADPVERCWAIIAEYLAAFGEMPHAATLWFGYWVAAIEDGRREPVERMHAQITAVLEEALAAAGAPDADTGARALFSYLVGTVTRQAVQPVRLAEVRGEIAMLAGIGSAA